MARDELAARKALQFKDVLLAWTIALGASGLALLLLRVLG